MAPPRSAARAGGGEGDPRDAARRHRQVPRQAGTIPVRRIAKGAGKSVEEVNQLIKQFEQMGKMMKMMQGGKGRQMMQQLQGLK